MRRRPYIEPPRIASTALLAVAVLAIHLTAGCDSSTESGPDWTGLLTDEELRTVEDPNAPEVDSLWAEWIEANNVPIRSLDAGNYTDLLALSPYFQEARIVQLGENGHGAAEFDRVKVRLIQFLHEIMGFNVVVLESSIFECYYADHRILDLDPPDAMVISVPDVWRCDDVLHLFEYLRQRRALGAGLHLAGVDTRVTPNSGGSHRPDFLRGLLETVDPDSAEHAYSLDSEFLTRAGDEDYIREAADSLIAEYEAVAGFIERHEEQISAAFPDDPAVAKTARRIVLAAVRHIEQLYLQSQGREGAAFETRDLGMTENLEFLLNELYPGEKFVVWAHNAHVCHDYESIPERGTANMGHRIYDAYGSELYTVGLYMYRGSAATNDLVTRDVPEAVPGSIESILYRTRRKHCFIDMLGQPPVDGNAWMFQTVVANEWDRGELSLVPRDQYDAILFVDTVSPPDFAGD